MIASYSHKYSSFYFSCGTFFSYAFVAISLAFYSGLLARTVFEDRALARRMIDDKNIEMDLSPFADELIASSFNHALISCAFGLVSFWIIVFLMIRFAAFLSYVMKKSTPISPNTK